MICIKDHSKASVLAALYNRAKPQGMGFLHYTPHDMTAEQAEGIVSASGEHLFFDYLHGRVMKVDIKGDEFDPYLYDRDNGEGAAASALVVLTCQPAESDRLDLEPGDNTKADA